MIHELLLALSGLPSPFLESTHSDIHPCYEPALATAEKGLIKQFSRLGALETEIRARATDVDAHHPSIICQAVAASVLGVHLAAFQDDIISIEHGILCDNPLYIGAYSAVPLSGLLTSIDKWSQILDWLRQLLIFLQVSDGKLAGDLDGRRSGAQTINWLKRESQTGHHELEHVILGLLNVAESTWLRQVSTWVLYGRLPACGKEDFFIQPILSSEAPGGQTYAIDNRLAPEFVDKASSCSMLYIGKSLRHIQGRMQLSPSAAGTNTVVCEVDSSDMLKEHLRLLSSIRRPISTSSLSRVVGSIRHSLARRALQLLLPPKLVVQTLSVLHEFLLAGRIDFADALIVAADERLDHQHINGGAIALHADAHRIKGSFIKEGELAGVIGRAFAAMHPLPHDADAEEHMDLARDMIQIVISKQPSKTAEDTASTKLPHSLSRTKSKAFQDVLFGTPTTLRLRLESPLDLILTSDDIETYSAINAYLLSIRRAHLHLADVWKLSVLRRQDKRSRTMRAQSATPGASGSSSHTELYNRDKHLRRAWTTVSSSNYFLTEFGSFIHSELDLIWMKLRDWISSGENDKPYQPSSGKAQDVSRDDTAAVRDPETVSAAHKHYLSTIYSQCLLSDQYFTKCLRALLTHVDHIVALMRRLAHLQQVSYSWSLDNSQRSDETSHEIQDILEALQVVEASIEEVLGTIVSYLRDLDSESAGGRNNANGMHESSSTDFTTSRSTGLGSLLIRLDLDEGRIV